MDLEQRMRAAQDKKSLSQEDYITRPPVETMVQEAIACFNGRIIRRDLNSLKPDGSCIISLPPLEWVKALLPVLEHDRPLLAQLIQKEAKMHMTLTFVSTKVRRCPFPSINQC